MKTRSITPRRALGVGESAIGSWEEPRAATWRGRRRLARALPVLALLLFAGCETPVADNTVSVGVRGDVGPLLPVLATSSLSEEINEQLYLGLNTARWHEGAIDYRIDALSLAEGWEFGADSTTLTYTIRPEAVWSDGQPIRAADVVFTYELVRRPEIASPRREFWETIDSVLALDDRRVRFHFSRPYPGMLLHTGLGIIPAHVFEGHATDQATLANHPSVVRPGGQLVVSGPFRVAEMRPGDRLVLVPNERAFTVSPRLERVVFRSLPEETTRLVELKNGTIDLIYPAPLESAAELQADQRFYIETVARRFYDYLAFNGDTYPQFADPEVRRALSYAIDRVGILEGLGYQAYAEAAGGPYPPIFRDLAGPSPSYDPYLPDSARAILEARGWTDRDGDGIRERGNDRLSFTLLTQAGQSRRLSAAQIIQAQLRQVGVEMAVQQLEFNALLDVMFEERGFQAVLLGWQVGLEPDYLMGLFWPKDHPFNITGYTSAALDSLIPLALSASNRREAAVRWRAIAEVIARDRPYAFLWFFDELAAANRRLQGVRIDTYGVFQNLHEWRLE